MHLSARSLRLAALATGLAAAGSSAARAQGTDPFQPATRWSSAPLPGAPWIPASVEFAAGGDWIFAAGAVGAPQWMLFSTSAAAGASGTMAPWSSAAAAPGTVSNMAARGGDSARELFALCQVPDPDAAHKRTEVARFDALLPGGLAPAWTHDLGWRVAGGAKLATAADGSRAAAAVHDSAGGRLRVDWLDGASGALTARADFAAGTLRELAGSEDLARVALVAGAELWVLDATGLALHHELLGAATRALAISGDGQTLLVGGPGLLRVLGWNGSAYVERARETAPAAEVPVRCALSRDGATWAAGWWNSATGRDVRLELRAAPSDSLVWQETQSAASSAPQNFPEAVALAQDGSRAAFGLWGTADAAPEVILVDRASAAALARLDLPGSVLALALDPSATRLAIAMKHAHANHFASTGEVQLYDTGERDLQARDQARIGQPLPVAARRPGATAVWFLYGPRAAAPRPLPGIAGTLELARPSLSALRAPADAAGRADALLPPPPGPQPPGVHYSVQALFRSRPGGALSAAVLDPLAL